MYNKICIICNKTYIGEGKKAGICDNCRVKESQKAIKSFNSFIKVKEKEQEVLYENEEFYRDDIEQNELFLKMLHSVSKAIKRLQAKAKAYDSLIEKLKEDVEYGEEFESDLEPTIPEIRAEYAQELLDTQRSL